MEISVDDVRKTTTTGRGNDPCARYQLYFGSDLFNLFFEGDAVSVTVTRSGGGTATFTQQGDLGRNITSITISIIAGLPRPPGPMGPTERENYIKALRTALAIRGGIQPGGYVTIRVYKRIQITYDVPKLFGKIRLPFSKKKETGRQCL